ncbi:hypothetical protein KIPB_008747 [Kipferlia bialata]|uniref:Uncharacterized protein n=1 Tax=Kipferlia bialata TaxID=797122 RepID=A0A9K3D178_9EUKA|nr:hypothetical protein KIPB_008747 [Kipferlia bialata]|eukprot:g8747.t1
MTRPLSKTVRAPIPSRVTKHVQSASALDLSTQECNEAAALAKSVFRQRPRLWGCCQSVVYTQGDAIDDGRFPLTGELDGMEAEECYGYVAKFNSGKERDNTCGACKAACMLLPDLEDTIRASFVAEMGSYRCREIKKAKDPKCSCDACVALGSRVLAKLATPLMDSAGME